MTVDSNLAALVDSAVVEDRLRVVYQPCVRLSDGVPVGVEALLRMHDHDGRVVMPDVFIPVAEQTGAIAGLGLHVMQVACEQVAWWKDRMPPAADLVAGINVSPVQLRDPELIEAFEQARGRLDRSAVVLELTENMPPPSCPRQRGRLHDLRALGYHLALDDFGTGHASTRTLRELPFDSVKIDRSWTARLGASGAAGDLARSLTETAVRSGCLVVVEGIETLDDRDAAGALGCGLGQGYLWSRPVPAEELTRWLVVHGALDPGRATQDAGCRDEEPGPGRAGAPACGAGQPGSEVALTPSDSRVSGRV